MTAPHEDPYGWHTISGLDHRGEPVGDRIFFRPPLYFWLGPAAERAEWPVLKQLRFFQPQADLANNLRRSTEFSYRHSDR